MLRTERKPVCPDYRKEEGVRHERRLEMLTRTGLGRAV